MDDLLQEIAMTPIGDITPYPFNQKQHPEAQINRVAHSIATYGFDQPIVVDKDMVIIKGHGRYFAAKKLELSEVPVLRNTTMTEDEVKASRIADNKVAESEWDTTVLWEEMSDLKDTEDYDLKDFGFSHQSVKNLFKEQDLEKFGVGKTTREEEYDKYHEDKDRRDAESDEDADVTSVQIESFMNAFTGDKQYLRHMPILDYLNLHDKILVGASGGKDSCHSDSAMWYRIDGEVVYSTPGELVDELITIKTKTVKDNGQVIIQSEEFLETLTPTSMYLEEAEVAFRPVNYIMYHDTDKPLYKITTHNNQTVRVTEDHSLVKVGGSNSKGMRIQEQTIPTKDIGIGDVLPTIKRMNFDSSEVDIPDYMLRLCGLWIADGCYAVNRKIVMSTGNDEKVLDFLRKIPRPKTQEEQALDFITDFTDKYPQIKLDIDFQEFVSHQTGISLGTVKNVVYRGVPKNTTGGKSKQEYIYVTVKENGDAWLACKSLVQCMQSLGFVGTCREKAVPSWLFSASNRQIALFLAGFFDGDGSLHNRGITASGVNVSMIKQIHILLGRIGVHAAVSTAIKRIGGYTTKEGEMAHISICSNKGVESFIQKVPTFKSKDLIGEIAPAVQSNHSIQASKVKKIEELPVKNRRVFDFEVEDSNHLFIADNIVVHNSTAGLLWCLENIDHDKLIPYFGDLGWGIDWPHAITYIKVIEKMYNIKIICSGDVDPYIEGGFNSGLIQYGFPHPVSCWVRNHIKIRNTKAVQMKYKKDGGFSMCVILSVRWAESLNRRKTYSDRGILKDGNMHFASPILQWTDTDVCKFLWDRDLRLSTPYQHADRMGCILCPHEGKKTAISVRKKFPELFAQILDWHSRGARRTRGDLAMHHVKKLICEVSDLQEHEKKQFAGVLSPLALSPKDYEAFLEEKLGGELPCKDYTRIKYDSNVHIFANDIDQEYYRRADLAPSTGDVQCTIFG